MPRFPSSAAKAQAQELNGLFLQPATLAANVSEVRISATDDQVFFTQEGPQFLQDEIHGRGPAAEEQNRPRLAETSHEFRDIGREAHSWPGGLLRERHSFALTTIVRCHVEVMFSKMKGHVTANDIQTNHTEITLHWVEGRHKVGQKLNESILSGCNKETS
jgi:hypothetical protein